MKISKLIMLKVSLSVLNLPATFDPTMCYNMFRHVSELGS